MFYFCAWLFQVFASADIYFSMDSKKFSEFPVRWTPKRDVKNETSLLIDIPLKGRLAKYIRLEFYHSNHWLLFSEISFLSGKQARDIAKLLCWLAD